MKSAIGSPPVKESSDHGTEIVRLDLEEMGPLGDTLASYQGERIGVFGGIPGEEVMASIIRYRKKRRRIEQVSAIVTEALRPSPYRVTPPCPYFGPCSGCQWQHIDYPHQLTLKRDAVVRHLSAYDELRHVSVSETVPAPEEFGYRNHARFTVRYQGYLGFINRLSRRFVQVNSCMLMSPWINKALGALRGRSGETSQLSVRYGINTSEWLIQPTMTNPDIPLATGQTHYREALLGKVFRIASPSFFQVNTRQAEQLALLVRKRLQLTGAESLVDAYAGVGTFAVLLAPSVRRVVAIEESAAAVEDAARNAAGIDNIELRLGKTEEVLGALDFRPDAVILDPPRVGCQRAALDAIAELAPRRAVYVSCDPETLARDLRILVRAGLSVERVEPVDMFPQTHHVECVATLFSNGPEHPAMG
jgi:23S rRNA (uracil1939-C5)-methyltransferase